MQTTARSYERRVPEVDGREQHRAYTIREATCQLHGRKTTSFAGVNASGWVFGCYGPRDVKQSDELAHFFVASAPVPEPVS